MHQGVFIMYVHLQCVDLYLIYQINLLLKVLHLLFAMSYNNYTADEGLNSAYIS